MRGWWSLLAAAHAVFADAYAVELDDRVAGGLWGLMLGDALAQPVHWYYGGPEQIRRDFGGLLTGMAKAVYPFPESIMQLSNTAGAGRGGDDGDIVGSVILHGKKKYWSRHGEYHYHHTLEAGENTLEAALARLLIRRLAANGGKFDEDNFRASYVEFMTTPDTHSDAYASTCHRMFFKNWHSGVDPKDCPSNDGHNVDTMDGLVLPAVALLVELGSGSTAEEAAAVAVSVLRVTRKSAELVGYIQLLALMMEEVFKGQGADAVAEAAYHQHFGGTLRAGVGDRDPIVACYIGGSFPALLHFVKKYASSSPREALLASANAGGENVHRGAVLGALLGAASGIGALPKDLLDDLVAKSELREEVKALLQGIRQRRKDRESERKSLSGDGHEDL